MQKKTIYGKQKKLATQGLKKLIKSFYMGDMYPIIWWDGISQSLLHIIQWPLLYTSISVEKSLVLKMLVLQGGGHVFIPGWNFSESLENNSVLLIKPCWLFNSVGKDPIIMYF